MAEDFTDPHNRTPFTDLERDAMLDALEVLPPASEFVGDPGHELAAAAARRAQAVRLRLSGATYEQIAQTVGYSDKSTARQVVLRSLTRLEAESVVELRALENARLDADELVLRSIIQDPTARVPDRLRAIETRTRLSARRARMNGLDAPLQVELSAGVRADLEDAISEAEAALSSVVGEVLNVSDEPGVDTAPLGVRILGESDDTDPPGATL